MKTVVIGFASLFPVAEKFFTETLGMRYNVVRDDENPHYLIYGGYDDHCAHHRFRDKAKRIFFTGENLRPTFYEFEHFIGFDFEASPLCYRMPLYVLEMYNLVHQGITENFFYLRDRWISDPEQLLYRHNGFCSFLVRNGNPPLRNMFFDLLSEYKKVDSGGPHRNNIGREIPFTTRDTLDFLAGYKFNICFENQCWPGYVTEKPFNALVARTVPIYCGSPNVERDFNPKAMINVYDFPNLEEVVKYVKHLDSDEGKKEYLDILAAPAFVGPKVPQYANLESFLDWWEMCVL